MPLDITTFIGRYPWHDTPAWSAAMLKEELTACGIDRAWVSDFSAMFGQANLRAAERLRHEIAPHEGLAPVFSLVPGGSEWEAVLDLAVACRAPAVRPDPALRGLPLTGPEMLRVAAACAERSLPIMLAVRLEDGRQRVAEDRAPELAPWVVRQLVRSHPALRLIVTHADREFVEQVHFGSTPEEARRILWDITWLWGPPEDHLALLCETVGVERFALGTGTPLRLTENGLAKLDLLDLRPDARWRVAVGNAEGFRSSSAAEPGAGDL